MRCKPMHSSNIIRYPAHHFACYAEGNKQQGCTVLLSTPSPSCFPDQHCSLPLFISLSRPSSEGLLYDNGHCSSCWSCRRLHCFAIGLCYSHSATPAIKKSRSKEVMPVIRFSDTISMHVAHTLHEVFLPGCFACSIIL